MKGNKLLILLVLICLAMSGYSVWQCYTLKNEVEKLRQERVAVNQSNDILNEAIKIIQGKSGVSTQSEKKKGLVDKAKSAAQAKALDMVANKVKKSVQEKAEHDGKDASTTLRGIDMICFWGQQAITPLPIGGSRHLPHCRLGPAGNYHIVNLGSPMLAIRIFL